MDSRIVRLVRDDRAPVVATQVLVLPGAANPVTLTSGVIAESRESAVLCPAMGCDSGSPTTRQCCGRWA